MFGILKLFKYFILQLFNILCLRLFGYYRENSVESKAFSLQFVPSLIYTYLSAIAQGEKKVIF